MRLLGAMGCYGPNPFQVETATLIFFFSASLLSSLELSDTTIYEPQMRARLETTAHLCEVVVLK